MKRHTLHDFGTSARQSRRYTLPMTKARQHLGLVGERIAYRFLKQFGWTLIAHRFRSGHRDLDLIMQLGDLIAFIEVKARRGDAFGDPIEAVHARKRRELIRSAQIWTDRHGTPELRYRFDVVGVLISGRNVRVRHIPDAFSVTLT